MRRFSLLLLFISLSACGEEPDPQPEETFIVDYSPERLDQVEVGGRRAAAAGVQGPDLKAASGETMEWIANLTFSGCPEASDWFDMQDRIRAGDYTADLPSRCFKIVPGDRILAQGHGRRTSVEYNGHTYEQGTLPDGQAFWTDSLDEVSISRVP